MKAPTIERRRLVVTGMVQGVGFRPFVHRLANRLHLAGTVTNVSARVVIDVTGMPDLLDRFQRLLVDEAPPLASIESLIADRLDAGPGSQTAVVGFTISDSSSEAGHPDQVFVAPDTAHCDACRAEMNDPANRRHRHPFISCTDCGPRFTIIESLPYDRPATTMASFVMCDACHAEYHDPTDRRFHAQPIACHDCGPTLRFHPPGKVPLSSDSVAPELLRSDGEISSAAGLILQGGVLVVKGIGGFQLACDAGNARAVAALRCWKQRPDKPLALLVRRVEDARFLVALGASEEVLLSSPARPIVLAQRLHGNPQQRDVAVCEEVAPTQPRLGVMLPPSPLHELLAEAVGRPMVLTSGNRSGAPICHRDDHLPDLLAGWSDLDPGVDGDVGVGVGVLTHDRPIAVPCDDSVVRVGASGPTFIRRARGYAPTSVDVGGDGPPFLAVGGQLKNTFCLVGHTQGWVGQHVGDMDDLDTVTAFGASVERFEQFYRAEPEFAVVDAHPDHGPRAWLRRHRPELPVVEVQHHHAHVASVLAEYGVGSDQAVIGVAFDGTGYGLALDGGPAVWGGEFLAVTGGRFRRIGHLRPVLLPGGDAAVVNPYRVALAYLRHCELDPHGLPPGDEADPHELTVVTRQLQTGFGCLPNSSMGRLFDAVSSIIGLRHRISYEAQGAIDLELAAGRAAAGGADVPDYRFALHGSEHRGSTVLQADARPVLQAIVDDLGAGRPTDDIALGFHRAVTELIVELIADQRTASTAATDLVALSGGVFQNTLLTDETVVRLEDEGFVVLTNRLVPPNDGGLALGQAYVGRHHTLTPASTPSPYSESGPAAGGPSCA